MFGSVDACQVRAVEPLTTDRMGGVMQYPELHLWIGDRALERTESGESIPVINPADGTVLGMLPAAGPREIESAVNAADRGFNRWSVIPALDRFRILTKATALIRERCEAIAQTLTLEQGKPLAEARREIALSADIIDFLAEEGKRLGGREVAPRALNILTQSVRRVPVGPVAAFTPWNFPANLPSRKLGGALAAGCSVIVKPSEETPATCMELVRAFIDAGLPEGVLNLVCGSPSAIADALIASPQVAKISFTGSVAVGKALAAQTAGRMKRYTMELGGHAPVIVCADADPGAAAALAVPAKFRNAGQVCAAPVRFLVHRSVYASFRDAFVSGTLALKVGSGLERGVQVGPLVHERRILEMQDLIADAMAQGGQLLCGGKRIDRPGYFFEPTVIEGAGLRARVQREEPFGPIALIDVFDDLQEAISRANSLPYGLAAYAFTHELATADRLGRELQAGMVGINHFGVSQPETPFGGVKESGFGSESGLEGLLGYTDVKLVSVAS